MPARSASFPSSPPDLDALLQGVSRSFHLSIRLLPAPLRRPVSAGYLLARAADTIADAAALSPEDRSAHLQTLRSLLMGEASSREALPELASATAAVTHDARERALLEQLPACLDLLAALGDFDAQAVRTVLGHITRGQLLDVERFPGADRVRLLRTAAELNDYTYLVAGSVGEFWTDLCVRHLQDFARLPAAEMRSLARRYGMGLQLVNVLRDMRADLAMGRCYLPADEMAAAGGDAHAPLQHPHAFGPVRSRWLAAAAQGLHCGMQYADAVQSRRVRAASALPALIGLRTVAMLRSQSAESLEPVKMPRSQVRALLFRLALSLASRSQLKRLANRMGESRA